LTKTHGRFQSAYDLTLFINDSVGAYALGHPIFLRGRVTMTSESCANTCA